LSLGRYLIFIGFVDVLGIDLLQPGVVSRVITESIQGSEISHILLTSPHPAIPATTI